MARRKQRWSSWTSTKEPTLSVGPATDGHAVPPLDVAMLIAGTRGDVQPFVALALELQRYGHRVRVATHATFRQVVERGQASA
jgi:hypothetical protein